MNAPSSLPSPAALSRTLTFVDGDWHEGNPLLMGPRTHAFWQGSSVFDGARVFENVMPDMDLHAARVNRSAKALGLEPTLEAGAITELAREGAKRFGPGAELYVRPMYWADADGPSVVMPDPGSTRFLLCLYETPMPKAGSASAITVSRFRRPSLETMPTDAKAGCLYPNSARALREAKASGFDNALMLDMLGNVSETATSNIFLVKDGVVKTPSPNGTFLNGITRQSAIALMRDAGMEVVETGLSALDFKAADEVFTSGNFSKVLPVSRLDDASFQPGPVAAKVRKLYWDYAHAA